MMGAASAGAEGGAGPRLLVSFAAGGRPETATQVRLQEWEGPIGLLLALVEARRLDIRTVRLGELADAYLDALATLEGDRLANVSAFVAVASQLILIKSRELLPRPPAPPPATIEEPDPEADLRARLVLYRAFRDAGAALADRAAAGLRLVRREPAVALAAGQAGAAPPAGPALDPALLAGALEELLRVVPPPPPPPETFRRTITLAERAAVIRAALAAAGSIVLQDLLRGARDRVVVAVTFMALLELVRRREVSIGQEEPWGPIVVTPAAGPDVGGRAEATG
ncbi:MAG: segregation/condensation protein A [Chloroflexi bacterium]|jgi:segregation and condensation protein A|nr:segregation/condensation protein A [Chloroflexota bacterium]